MQEVDVSGYFARPSGLATEKLHVGPVATALDLHVYSRAGTNNFALTFALKTDHI